MQSYWAFPPGKNLTTFQRDELYCNTNWIGLISTCLKSRGYKEIPYEEFLETQKRAQQELEAGLKPMDVAAYEVSSNEIFIGKSESFLETKGDGSRHTFGFAFDISYETETHSNPSALFHLAVHII